LEITLKKKRKKRKIMSFQAGMKKEKFKIRITQISKNKKKRSVKYKNKI
jgi:hypothetical protein